MEDKRVNTQPKLSNYPQETTQTTNQQAQNTSTQAQATAPASQQPSYPPKVIQPTLNSQFQQPASAAQVQPKPPVQVTSPVQSSSTPVPQPKPTVQPVPVQNKPPTQPTNQVIKPALTQQPNSTQQATNQPQQAPQPVPHTHPIIKPPELKQNSDGAGNYEKKFKIYKPYKVGVGGAVQFDFNQSKKSVFAEAAKQVPNQQAFDWANKLSFKLSTTDMAKLLVVLRGKLPSLELFHDPSKGGYAVSSDTKNSTLGISKSDKGYYFKLSSQTQGGQLNSVQISLTEDEGIVLGLLMEEAIRKSFDW